MTSSILMTIRVDQAKQIWHMNKWKEEAEED